MQMKITLQCTLSDTSNWHVQSYNVSLFCCKKFLFIFHIKYHFASTHNGNNYCY